MILCHERSPILNSDYLLYHRTQFFAVGVTRGHQIKHKSFLVTGSYSILYYVCWQVCWSQTGLDFSRLPRQKKIFHIVPSCQCPLSSSLPRPPPLPAPCPRGGYGPFYACCLLNCSLPFVLVYCINKKTFQPSRLYLV